MKADAGFSPRVGGPRQDYLPGQTIAEKGPQASPFVGRFLFVESRLSGGNDVNDSPVGMAIEAIERLTKSHCFGAY